MTFGGDTKKSIWWDLLTFWNASKGWLLILCLFGPFLVLIIKLSKLTKRPRGFTKGWLSAVKLQGSRRLINALHIKTILDSFCGSGGGSWTERQDKQMIFIKVLLLSWWADNHVATCYSGAGYVGAQPWPMSSESADYQAWTGHGAGQMWPSGH